MLGFIPLTIGLLAVTGSAGLPDRGVFPELDARVAIALPAWVPAANLRVVVDRPRRLLTVLAGREPVKSYPVDPKCAEPTLDCVGLRPADRDELARLPAGRLPMSDAAVRDSDCDGIPDAVDTLLGAKKAVLLASRYVETSPKLAYPGGDVPTSEGVCTDVVVRALRNAGIDLQKEIFEDAGRAPTAYPAIPKRNPNIDHRRVRNLLAYFGRHWRRVERLEDLLPGDVAMLDTFPNRKGVEHIGIVSDRLGKSEWPLIINAWTVGYQTSEMDLLGFVPMPVAFRAPAATGATPPASSSFHVPAETRQLVTVVTSDWGAGRARLAWWQRQGEGPWVRQGGPVEAVVGSAGLGWGRGIHPAGLGKTLGGPEKREGDNRGPAGAFRLSQATGYAEVPAEARIKYRRASAALRCVDDAASPSYNQLVEAPAHGKTAWASDEPMLRTDGMYALAIVVDHNRDPVEPGAGSCIFIHPWVTAGVPSPGCTMLARAPVERLVRWLDPAAHPLLVQLPRAVFRGVAMPWALPSDDAR
jgi:uncharacterized protein YijF (DUF1287 family)/L,D-peptidoglycan transpeptidase YkuD (ErfK/YbiS/YcfS/YnhG family)